MGVPRRRGSVSSNASSVQRYERAVSEPPQIKKQSKGEYVISKRKSKNQLLSYWLLVTFVKRSVSEPTTSTVDEELGMIGRLKLVREVKEDTIESLQDA